MSADGWAPPSISLFTTAKPFTGHAGVIQRNALRSWSLLDPRPEILLVGDEEGYEEAAQDLGLRRIFELERNEFGTPLVSGLFRTAKEHCRGSVLVFLNADIILPPRFVEALWRSAQGFGHFLLVGRRIDLEITEPLAFEDGWYEKLERRASLEGRRRGDLCIDYFAFSKDLFSSIPPFAIGRTRYDNWLIWRAAEEGAVVIDASPFVQVMHQNHDYGHTGGLIKAWEGIEARRAEALLGHWSHYHSISHARFALTPSGDLQPAHGARYRLARPRRVASHLLRWTRPLRRRARLLFGRPSKRHHAEPK